MPGGRETHGKSTIVIAVMRLLPANAKVSGQIIFDGTDLTQVSDGS